MDGKNRPQKMRSRDPTHFRNSAISRITFFACTSRVASPHCAMLQTPDKVRRLASQRPTGRYDCRCAGKIPNRSRMKSRSMADIRHRCRKKPYWQASQIL